MERGALRGPVKVNDTQRIPRDGGFFLFTPPFHSGAPRSVSSSLVGVKPMCKLIKRMCFFLWGEERVRVGERCCLGRVSASFNTQRMAHGDDFVPYRAK